MPRQYSFKGLLKLIIYEIMLETNKSLTHRRFSRQKAPLNMSILTLIATIAGGIVFCTLAGHYSKRSQDVMVFVSYGLIYMIMVILWPAALYLAVIPALAAFTILNAAKVKQAGDNLGNNLKAMFSRKLTVV